MARHSHRDTSGRWATPPSGAPIPDAEGQGDTSAYALGDDRSAHPSTDPEAFPSFVQAYPDHDPRLGGLQRSIPHRTMTTVAETGQQMAYRVDHEVRGLDTYLGGGDLRSQAHLQAAQGDPLAAHLFGRPSDNHDPRPGHKYASTVVDDLVHNDPTHTAWPGEFGKAMRERP